MKQAAEVYDWYRKLSIRVKHCCFWEVCYCGL